MDLWVVAAATAAGYAAKYWQNFSRGGGGDSLESPSGNCPLSKLGRREKVNKEVHTPGRNIPNGDDMSTCESDNHLIDMKGSCSPDGIDYPSDCNKLSTSYHIMRHVLRTEPGCSRSSDIGDCYLDGRGVTSFNGSLRSRTFLRRKRRYGRLVKPMSSMENCLVAQMSSETMALEEYVFAPFTLSSVPTVRPLIVTDGTRVINRVSGIYSNAQFVANSDNKLCWDEYPEMKGSVYGISQLPEMEPLDLQNEMSCKKGKSCPRRSSSSSKRGSRKRYQVGGSNDSAVFLCLGVCIGVLSSLISSKKEVDKLKELLHQTENLVQDLHEELEIRDSITVKEIASEKSVLHDIHVSSHDRAPTPIPSPKNADEAGEGGEKRCDGRAEETLQPMSKIEADLEAELEAELERLELSMSTSRVERRLSDIIELDPDFEAGFAQGELRAENINGQGINKVGSNQDGSSSDSTPPFRDYAVSPHDLTLRLHELIQSRLEERIKELETALIESERKVQLMEIERKNSPMSFWATREWERKPVPDNDSLAQPLVMNLSGEALDAYHEACDVFMKIDDSEEENSQSNVQDKSLQEESPLPNQHAHRIQNDHCRGSLGDRTSEDVTKDRDMDTLAEAFSVPDFLDVGSSEDDNSEVDDEMEKKLIRQIVEKTKQGSPVVLNAQKMLFLMDDDEH